MIITFGIADPRTTQDMLPWQAPSREVFQGWSQLTWRKQLSQFFKIAKSVSLFLYELILKRSEQSSYDLDVLGLWV
jgi:hypothetical protein